MPLTDSAAAPSRCARLMLDPMSPVASARLTERERSAGNVARVDDPSRGGRILLVEDEAGIADFVRRGLEGEGFLVHAAADGVEGERLALEGGFDAVVLDLMLPGRPGLEILGKLHSEKPSLPVIVLTARSEVEDKIAGLEAGAVDYL